MYSLDYHDGIIHHDGDGQQQSRKREQIDGETEYPKEEERTYQRHRHGNERDECGTEVLQEDVHHEEHENESDHESHHHFFDRGVKELCHIVVDLVFQPRREILSLLLELGFHPFGNVVGVGAGYLLHHTHHRRLVIVFLTHRVGKSAQLYLGHIAQVERLPVVVGADDDVAILGRSLQTTLIAHHVFEAHVALFTKLTRSGLDVLFGQCRCDVARDEPVLLHLVGLQPDTHGVGLGTEVLHVAHTRHTLQGRHDVDIVVVGHELGIVAAVFGRERVHDHVTRLSLGGGHTHLRHLGRQQCLSLRHAVLHVHGGHVGIGALLEVDSNHGHAVVGGLRGHVGHVLHAVNTFLKRGDHGVEHGLSVGTLIDGRHGNGWRRNIGILLDRQRNQADQTQQHKEDGNHRRKHRALYKSCKCHIPVVFKTNFSVILTCSWHR